MKANAVMFALAAHVALAGLPLWLPAGSRAQDATPPAAVARKEFERGVSLSKDGRWADAADAFARSLSQVPKAVTRYNLAIALFRAERPMEAVEAVDDYLAQPDAPEAAARELTGLREHAMSKLTRLTLQITPEFARLETDGRVDVDSGAEREVLLLPGLRRLRLAAPAYEPLVLTVAANEGLVLHRTLSLIPSVPAVAEASSTPAAAVAAQTTGTQSSGSEPTASHMGQPFDAVDGNRRKRRRRWIGSLVGVACAAAGAVLAVTLTRGAETVPVDGGNIGVVFD